LRDRREAVFLFVGMARTLRRANAAAWRWADDHSRDTLAIRRVRIRNAMRER